MAGNSARASSFREIAFANTRRKRGVERKREIEETEEERIKGGRKEREGGVEGDDEGGRGGGRRNGRESEEVR